MIITFANSKGGPGKTTMATHTAAGLAALDLRVGLVDSDQQGHVARLLGLPKSNGLYDLMMGAKSLAEVVVPVDRTAYPQSDGTITEHGGLFIIPSDKKSGDLATALQPEDTLIFLEKMDEFKREYALDIIIIDTKPNTDRFDGSIYLATDGFVFVTEPEDLSLDGVSEMMSKVIRFNKQRKKYLGRESAVLGIVVNKVRAGTSLHRWNARHLGDAYGDYVWTPPITLRIGWAEAVAMHQLVYTYSPGSQEATDAWSVVENVRKAIGYAERL